MFTCQSLAWKKAVAPKICSYILCCSVKISVLLHFCVFSSGRGNCFGELKRIPTNTHTHTHTHTHTRTHPAPPPPHPDPRSLLSPFPPPPPTPPRPRTLQTVIKIHSTEMSAPKEIHRRRADSEAGKMALLGVFTLQPSR